MSRRRLASTGRSGPDSHPAQLLYSHERGAEVCVLGEQVQQGAARVGPGLTRAAIPWPNLRCINKGGQPSFFSLIVGLAALADEKPPYS